MSSALKRQLAEQHARKDVRPLRTILINTPGQKIYARE